MENNKKRSTVLSFALIIVIIATALISASCNNPVFIRNSFNATTFNSDIVIKRTDGQEPLNMPYSYSKALLDNRLLFEEEIIGLNISSVKYEFCDAGMNMYGNRDVFVNEDSREVKAVMDSVKYCKGITTLSGIISDKEDSKITVYEGYSANLLTESLRNYVIIPSTLSRHINKEIPDNEKVLFIVNPGTNGLAYFTIIGEYTTNNEKDTLYLSYEGFCNMVRGGQEDISEHVDCMEIDVNEQADLKNFSFFLSAYFADINAPDQYENRINRLNEPYPYLFVNSVNIKPISFTEDTNFKKNIITVSRIDKKENLLMSYLYSDALIKDYYEYSRYITDINISTGIKGVNWRDYLTPADYKEYGLSVEPFDEFGNQWSDYRNKSGKNCADYFYQQAVTSISEIKKMKSNCKITFYSNYTNRDLVVQRKEDYKEAAFMGEIMIAPPIKGYAIIPVTMYEAARSRRNTDHHIIEMAEISAAYLARSALRVGFKVIGYYEVSEEQKVEVPDRKAEEIFFEFYDHTGNLIKMPVVEKPEYISDGYDVIYLSYIGYNDRYEREQFRNEYIESITIETRSDADIAPLIRYLEQYFAPATDVKKYEKEKNVLGLDYEYCYTIKEKAD